MKKIMTILIMAVLVFGLIGVTRTEAQSGIAVINPSACLSVQLSHNLFIGSTDRGTGGEVSALQGFLYNKGYLNVTPTGYFGLLTLGAVHNYQNANGIISTGYVGVLTRARIASDCNSTTPPVYSEPVHIDSLSPSSGRTGTSVTIRGTGFTNDSIIHFGNGGINGVSSNNGTRLTFVVPESIGPYCKPNQMCPMYLILISKGTYNVWVENSNGSSNTVNFTVTNGSVITPTPTALSIDSLLAPSRLRVDQSGTWTLDVNSSSSNNALRYSVNWGDEYSMRNSALSSGRTVSNQATFTHAYSEAGTYTPVFTVTDDSGASVTTSATVRVTNN